MHQRDDRYEAESSISLDSNVNCKEAKSEVTEVKEGEWKICCRKRKACVCLGPPIAPAIPPSAITMTEEIFLLLVYRVCDPRYIYIYSQQRLTSHTYTLLRRRIASLMNSEHLSPK